MIVLYATDVSLYAAKVAIGLEYKGVAYQRRLPPGGTYRSPEYRALVPAGTVPALDDAGFILSESDAILEYIEETQGGPALLPGDARARARARFASRIHDLRVEPRVRALFAFLGGDPARARPAVQALREAVAGLDALVAPAPFAAGAAFSLGDCGWAPTFHIADLLLPVLEEAPLACPPAIAAWRDTLAAMPAVQKVMAPYRDALAAWMRGKFGG